MSRTGTESISTANESKLEIIGYDDKDPFGSAFIVKSPTGHILKISDTFAEMFPMWVGRVLITADSERWTLTAAQVATGLATSVIMSPAEAGIECIVPAGKTPDNRVGVLIQIYNRNRFDLRNQMILRVGQCIMTCPTASAFDGMPDAKRRMKIGRSIRLFGDGFQKKALVGKRKAWRIPVMEGDFVVENSFGAAEAIGGGNFLIFAKDKLSGLRSAEEAVKAIRANAAITPMEVYTSVRRCQASAKSATESVSLPTLKSFCETKTLTTAESSMTATPRIARSIAWGWISLRTASYMIHPAAKKIRRASTVPEMFSTLP